MSSKVAKKKVRRAQVTEEEPRISPFAAQHGDYRSELIVDLDGELGGKKQSMVRVLRNVGSTTVDRWLVQGGPGFEEPQRKAVDHVRSLWAITGGGPRVIASYARLGAGGSSSSGVEERENYLAALHSLQRYEREFPAYVWNVFEQVVRFDEPAGIAGSSLASNNAQRQAHAKACTGFVASKIAEWRGY